MYKSALRGYTSKRIEEIETGDILVGIPCYNNEKTITHVIQMVTHGLNKYLKSTKNIVFIADGGSTDDTREVAKEFEIKPWQEKIVSIYRGPAGKGSAVRSILETAARLEVKACAIVDSDIRSITSDWIKYLIEPILERGYHFVAPVYSRHKYDGTITNNIVYNLTRALYGKRIRQPIGGDFAFSKEVVAFYISHPPLWETEVARFGIDIWMTTQAITHQFKVCQANLGVKIHDAKDPADHLGPMFRQVIWTLFSLMEENEEYWTKVKGSVSVQTFGFDKFMEPEPININIDNLVYKFKMGFKQFGAFWKDVLDPASYKAVKEAFRVDKKEFRLPVETWVKILYELAATFHYWPLNREKLVDLMTPLYHGRVASFIRETWDMDSQEAEQLVEKQAQAFEDQKEYLIKIWSQKKDNLKNLKSS